MCAYVIYFAVRVRDPILVLSSFKLYTIIWTRLKCKLYSNGHAMTSEDEAKKPWKVRPSTFQPLRLRLLRGARQPCSDWLDTKHLAIALIHPSRQGFSSWAVFLCCKQILWANFCCEQIFWANSCSEQIWFLWAVFLYCEQIFFALSNLCGLLLLNHNGKEWSCELLQSNTLFLWWPRC
jgi:hypothetical protein